MKKPKFVECFPKRDKTLKRVLFFEIKEVIGNINNGTMKKSILVEPSLFIKLHLMNIEENMLNKEQQKLLISELLKMDIKSYFADKIPDQKDKIISIFEKELKQ